MVQKGEYLERPALIPVEDLWLEGLWHRGEGRPGLLVCPPLAGEVGMDAPPVAELAFQAARRGRASLRFQYRGFGASQGRPDPTRALEDARAAQKHLAECLEGQRLDLAGYRSGAEMALLLALESPRSESLVLVSPPKVYDLRGLEDRRILIVLGTLDAEAERGRWRQAMEGFDARLELIDGADARFIRGLPLLGECVLDFLEKRGEQDQGDGFVLLR